MTFAKGSDNYTLKFGHLSSEDNTWHKAALKFKELVEERSQGKVQVKVYPNSQLGKEMDVINSIQLGTADMTITGESLQNWAPKAALMAVPYAFESSEQMRAAAGGVVGQEISQEITAKTGLVPLGWFERGPRYLTSNRPIKTPEDLKGIKLRVPNVPIFVKVWEELGAKPTPMAFSEVFTSLQQNTIEAQENPLSLIDSASFSEVQKNINLTAHVRSWIYVVIGEDKLNSLPADLQAIVKQAAIDMQAYENELFLAEEAQLKDKLTKAGMVMVEADQKAFASKAKVAVMKNLTPDQKALLEKIKN
ncbi:TRAP transporter substrate-binding protein [Lentisphaera marina]|uniref:TRAP transporter substrate-binding protein n=1 Tax=Lentisphaera marina TaxID=1111041 RepID=UPI002365B499|nr:TRAP transporter substrate-binding protein [Lentisphaera marina]MDD7984993.1 TRAP transporter substrate-binding protein [Lentisphaera marina]